MAQIGAIPGNGVNRPALSSEDIASRKLLLSWAKARNYAIGIDGIAFAEAKNGPKMALTPADLRAAGYCDDPFRAVCP